VGLAGPHAPSGRELTQRQRRRGPHGGGERLEQRKLRRRRGAPRRRVTGLLALGEPVPIDLGVAHDRADPGDHAGLARRATIGPALDHAQQGLLSDVVGDPSSPQLRQLACDVTDESIAKGGVVGLAAESFERRQQSHGTPGRPGGRPKELP